MRARAAVTRSRNGAVRDGLLVLLTLTTGAVDASCFLHLGNVFSSVNVFDSASSASSSAPTEAPGGRTFESEGLGRMKSAV